MDNSLYDILNIKPTNELKAYIRDMGEGYKPEAVEMAIRILKERGEATDDMLRNAQVKQCKTCKHSKPSAEGLLCDLSGAKADFLGNCKQQEEDDEAIRQQQRALTEKEGWGGMMTFYWIVIGLGAILTTVLALIQINPSLGWMIELSDLILRLGYAALCVYVIIAFMKRWPNALILGKIQCYALIVMNVLIIVFNQMYDGPTDRWNSTYRLIVSTIWSGIFLWYLCTNEQIKAVYTKEYSHLLKHDKPILWGTLLSSIVLLLGGIALSRYEVANAPLKELKTYVKEQNASLSPDPTADSYCTGYEIKDRQLVVSYHSNTYTNAELDEAIISYAPIYSKELGFFYPANIGDEMFEKCYEADHGIRIDWYDSNGEYTYSIDYSREDVNQIADEPTHTTSDEVWSEFLSAWNKQLPTEYMGISTYTSAELEGSQAVVCITLTDISKQELAQLNHQALENWLLSIFTDMQDHYILLAMLNGKDICYRFTADCDFSWTDEVVIPAEMYQEEE